MPKGDNRVLETKKTIILGVYWMSLFEFLYVGELGTCPQNLIFTRGVEHWEKNHFPQWDMLKFTCKGGFLTIKRHIKNYFSENPKGEYML
jgi:hypothetical protein